MWSDEEIEWHEFGSLNRLLAGDGSAYDEEDYDGKKEAIPLFYTILKYGIFTLYLVLFVEFVRHNIDHAARGRPFFTAVLTMAYSELATLGIVEFVLFLWGKYGTINTERKKKFADVHFALFLTAIFNALQYSLTSIVSTRLSNKLWVKTEQLELDHYVEIREEYERVQEIIDQQYTGCGKWVRNCILFVCRPGLRQRHESLRVQVRFHELRLHFLESNNLSSSLKVSDYLKRSELSILIGLVHVSVATWVLLIGLLNLGYFILGIIGFTWEPRHIAGLANIIFFVVDVSFIVLSMALRWKMRQIFQTVMKTKIIETSDHEEGIKNQNELFWFGSPTLVISMIQLMNFGYAISISIVIIYWGYLNETPVFNDAAFLYPVISIGCYIIFLYNLSALLPEYTLCTSLGYLTNRKELHEAVAKHRLEEAERQRRKKLIESATVSDSIIFQDYPVVESNSSVANNTGAVGSRNVVPLPYDKDIQSPLLVSDLVKIDTKSLRQNLPEESRENLMNRQERMRQRRANRIKSVSDGVATMRAWNQGSGNTTSQKTHEIAKRDLNRHPRIRRTSSQPGVIQAWQNITISEERSNISYSLDDIDSSRIKNGKNRRKSRSDPRAIQTWKESLGKTNIEGIVSLEEEVPIQRGKDTEVKKEAGEDLIPKWKKDRLNRLAARKRSRRKSQSASAIIQSWQDHSARAYTAENDGAVSDENYNSSDLRALSSDDGSDDNIITSKTKTSRFNKEKTRNHTPSVKQFNLRTLKEIEDHSQVSPMGATTDTKTNQDLSDAVAIMNGNDCNEDDGVTVNTDKSIGNLSDIDVIQAETVGIVPDSKRSLQIVDVDMSWYAALTRQLKLYLIGPVFRSVSHVVGTSIVFCFIGIRIEAMLIEAETLNDEETLKITFFWLEAVFLLWFIIADIIILVLFPICKCKTEAERRLGLATTIDVAIVGTVLTLLFVAEAQRCCSRQNERNLSGNLTKDDDAIIEDVFPESDCNCPSWGSRTHGGLGMIEPFTSLILFRLFRFQFCNFLIGSFYQKKESDEIANKMKPSPNAQHQTDRRDHNSRIWYGHDDHHDNKSGSALELWERAIADYPDVVQKHGIFSGELLQAMLGLQVATESPDVSFSEKLERLETKTNKIAKSSKCDSMKSHIKLAQSRYAKLPPMAQGIVIAGSLQKPVKPMHAAEFEKTGSEPSLASLSKTGLIDFEIDNERMHFEQNTSYPFVAPFARLVRSMRRCDRRHLPLLKGWISVDVVMTQFEIVYFEAIDSYYSNQDEKTRLHCEACRLALKATKGGKNLRLCDVALGRKVVGHLDFADVTEVHVAKDDVPISDMTLVEKASVLFDKEEDLDVEHWSSLYSETEANNQYARIIRWTLIQEERLKISTNSGTLYFRFYSDLAQFEAENSGVCPTDSHAITRDISFQWAETISRICGRSQLRQNLPHFGEENEAELRDYLEVVHFHEKEAENERKNNTRGVQNVGNVELLFLGAKDCGSEKKKVKHKRIKSMVDLTIVEMDGSVKNESLQVGAISASNQKHRRVKSFADFMDITRSQQKQDDRKKSSLGSALSSAENQV